MLPPFLKRPMMLATFGLGLNVLAGIILFSLLLASENAETRVREALQVRVEGYSLLADIRRFETAVRRASRGNGTLSADAVQSRLLTLENALTAFVASTAADPASDQLAVEEAMANLERDTTAILASDSDDGRRDALFETFSTDIDGLVAAVASARAEDVTALIDGRQRAGVIRPLLLTAVAGALLTGLFALGSAGVALARSVGLFSRREEELRGLNDTMEDTVARRTQDLERANAETQRFAYIVSHDLRSPLVNIIGFTHEIEEDLKALGALLARIHERAPDLIKPHERIAITEDVPEAIGFIQSSAAKMDRLIDAVLQQSREGRRLLKPERLDMDDLVRSVAASLATLSEEREATVTVEPLPRLVGDRTAVEQIFSNLIENAIKYGKPGRPNAIRIAGREEGKRVVFTVSDTGRGIAAKDHDRVFELFRRAGPQDQEGEGLGLSSVRHIIRRMHGDISFVSDVDKGTAFTFDLPKVLSKHDADRDENAG